MGHRILVFLVSACFSVLAGQVNALGLGEITLKSSLNQPLVAEIELLQVRDLTDTEVLVTLASYEDFERVGVDRLYFLTDLKFDVQLSESGKSMIVVTSKKHVREPFLNFVIDVQWPSGKLLREYTLLMDLPVFADEPVQPVNTARSQTSQTRSSSGSQPAKSTGVSNPRASYGTQRASANNQNFQPTYDGDTYPVKRNDTLWEIAEEVRPSGSVSIHQTMIALQQANPNAFINSNINLLKNGHVLRVPSLSEIQALNQSRSVQQVANQNAEWSGREYSAEVSGAPLAGSRTADRSRRAPTSSEGRLKLSSPDDTYDSTEGRSGGAPSDFSSEAIENELAITMEQLEKAQRDNADLRSKVESMEQQMETMERMVDVVNEQLRALQLSAKKNAEAEASNDDLYGQDDSAIADSSDTDSVTSKADELDELYGQGDSTDSSDSAVSDQDASADFTSDSDAAAEQVVAATPEPVKTAAPRTNTNKVVQRQVPPEPSLFDMIMDNIYYIVALIVAVLAGAYYFLKVRAKDDEFDDFFDELEEQSASPVEEESGSVVEEELPIDEVQDDELELTDASEDVQEHVTEEVETSAQQTEDVVAEADIYIAYGKYDQAEEMLVAALQRMPNDEAILVKLLEVHASQENIEGFDPLYARLRTFGTEDALDRADRLRAGFTDAPEFDESAFSSVDAGVESGELPSSEPSHDDIDTGASADTLDIELDEPSEEGIDADLDAFDRDFGMSGGDDDISLDLELDLDEPEEQDSDTDDELAAAFNLDDAGDSSESDFSLDTGDDLSIQLETDPEFDEKALEDSFSVDFSEGESTESDSGSADDVIGGLEEGSLDLEPLALDESEDIDFVIEEDDLADLDSSESNDNASDALNLDVDGGADDDITSFDLDDSDVDSSDLSLEEDELLTLDLDENFASTLNTSNDEPEFEISTEEEADAESGDDLGFGGDDIGSDADLSSLDDEISEMTADLGDMGTTDFDIELEPFGESDTDLEDLAGDDIEIDNLGGDSSDDALLDLDLESGLAPEGGLSEQPLDSDVDESLDAELLDSELDDLALELDGQAGEDVDLSVLDIDGSGGSADDNQDESLSIDLSGDEEPTVQRQAYTGEAESGTDTSSGEDDLSLEGLDEALDLAEAELNLGEEALDLDDEMLSLDESIDLDGDSLELVEEESEGAVEAEDFDLGDLSLEEDLGSLELETAGSDEEFGLNEDDLNIEPDLESDSAELLNEESGDNLDAATLTLDDQDDIPTMEEPEVDFDDAPVLTAEVSETAGSEPLLEEQVESNAAVDEFDGSSTTEFDYELPEVDPDADDDDGDLDFLSDSDETATKLDLARAYIDMGDSSGAKDILKEVAKEGTDEQQAEAEALIARIDS